MRTGATFTLILILSVCNAWAQTRRPLRSHVDDGSYAETLEPPGYTPDQADLLQQQTEDLYQQRSHDDRRPGRSHR